MKKVKQICLVLLLLCSAAILPKAARAEGEKIKVGVVLALTGDLAQLGTDQRNAITLANDSLGEGRYELLWQDDHCVNRDAISIAQKFIEIDKVKYVMGFSCNQTLAATAPIYEKAGVFVISSGGTSGDIPFMGKRNFRIFPSDVFGAETLFNFVKSRHKTLAILTEQTEYATMMERSFDRLNQQNANPLKISKSVFDPNDQELRSLLLKIKESEPDALYINADSDSSFIVALKQLAAIHFDKPRYAVYLGASATVLKEIPKLDEGITFSNLPPLNDLLSVQGRKLYATYKERFGEPLSGFPAVPPALEGFRVFDIALRKGLDPAEYLRGRSFNDGFLPPYKFDDNGNIAGIKFVMQKIVNGKVEALKE